MNKTFIGLAIVVALLTGCSEPEEYNKTTGEVVGKYISSGRFGDSYCLNVSYVIRDGKYAIDDVCVDKDIYSDYKVKDKVTVYGNKRGIGGVVK